MTVSTGVVCIPRPRIHSRLCCGTAVRPIHLGLPLPHLHLISCLDLRQHRPNLTWISRAIHPNLGSSAVSNPLLRVDKSSPILATTLLLCDGAEESMRVGLPWSGLAVFLLDFDYVGDALIEDLLDVRVVLVLYRVATFTSAAPEVLALLR